MKRRIRIAAARLMVAAGLVGAVAAPASAGVIKYETELDGHKERIFFHGVIRSEVGKCERDRLVVLFKKRDGADLKVDTDRSDATGDWSFIPPSGRFYAKVRRESGNAWVCLADRSPNHGTLGFN